MDPPLLLVDVFGDDWLEGLSMMGWEREQRGERGTGGVFWLRLNSPREEEEDGARVRKKADQTAFVCFPAFVLSLSLLCPSRTPLLS